MVKKKKNKTDSRYCRACGRRFIPDDKRLKSPPCVYCGALATKPKSITKLKDEAWIEFAKYIKLRDADARGIVKCVTCSISHRWDSPAMQAGHFLSGRKKGVLFDERGVHGQCHQCNIFRNGCPDAYWPYMYDRYGQEIIEEMIKNKNMDSGVWTRDELIEIKERYHEKAKVLLAQFTNGGDAVGGRTGAATSAV